MRAIASSKNRRINAKSPTGVVGKYQVTKATAQSFGLDRDDPWQQSVAAAKHLRKLFDETDGADDDEKWLGAVGKYYGGNNAVRNGELVGSSIDGVSNPQNTSAAWRRNGARFAAVSAARNRKATPATCAAWCIIGGHYPARATANHS